MRDRVPAVTTDTVPGRSDGADVLGETTPSSTDAVATSESSARESVSAPIAGGDFAERCKQVRETINTTLNQVDWNQAGLILKVVGIFTAVIVAQILIKGVLDTVNVLPIVPGLLELLGLVVAGRWSWDNLTTSQKREALTSRIDGWQKDYFG